MADFIRKQLPHDVPSWVPDGETFFITINCIPRGQNQLAKAEIFDAINNALINYESSGKWHVHLCLLMPDHLHALIAFNTRDHAIRNVVRTFKAYLAKTQGIQWQRYFFDHRIRNDHEFELKADYIRENPVRAALIENADDWPYVYENH